LYDTWRFRVECLMIPSRLDYRCIKSGVGYGGTGELGTVVTEFDSRLFDNILSTISSLLEVASFTPCANPVIYVQWYSKYSSLDLLE
jgi:hypothetical protein